MALVDLERDAHGYLVDLNTWNENIAQEIAEEEGINFFGTGAKYLDTLKNNKI